MNPLHEDVGMFREALALTQAQTGFGARLIEKDYFCTLLLEQLATACPGLIFKGGTCLAKVHAGFYRLSEDLDFVVPMPVDATRPQRSQRAAPLKAAVAALPKRWPCFRTVEPPTGANNSTQYNAVIRYDSLTAGREDSIKIEVALREPLLLPSSEEPAKTILLPPVSNRAALDAVAVPCIARTEAFAEKFRAALSRREVAARDFFDLDYAVRKLGLGVDDAVLIELVRQKLAVPGNEPVDVTNDRLAALRQQIDPQLRPVLRTDDFSAFDVERAFRLVAKMAAKVT